VPSSSRYVLPNSRKDNSGNNVQYTHVGTYLGTNDCGDAILAHKFGKKTDVVEEKDQENTYKLLSLFGEVFERTRREYVEEVTDQELIEAAINGMLTSLDPHSSFLNEKDMLRKDAIWFAEKGKDGGTDLYSLSDFNFRKELSFYNAYKLGKFGAIPNVD